MHLMGLIFFEKSPFLNIKLYLECFHFICLAQDLFTELLNLISVKSHEKFSILSLWFNVGKKGFCKNEKTQEITFI